MWVYHLCTPNAHHPDVASPHLPRQGDVYLGCTSGVLIALFLLYFICENTKRMCTIKSNFILSFTFFVTNNKDLIILSRDL